MHIGEPRPLEDTVSGHTYKWLLHWHDQLPRSEHFTLSRTSVGENLNMAMFYLLTDLKKAQRRFLRDLLADQQLQQNFHRAEHVMTATAVTIY
jgi:hypothetical protein